jgi:hypothetical protein
MNEDTGFRASAARRFPTESSVSDTILDLDIFNILANLGK